MDRVSLRVEVLAVQEVHAVLEGPSGESREGLRSGLSVRRRETDLDVLRALDLYKQAWIRHGSLFQPYLLLARHHDPRIKADKVLGRSTHGKHAEVNPDLRCSKAYAVAIVHCLDQSLS